MVKQLFSNRGIRWSIDSQILKEANFNGPMSITFEGGDVNECDDKEAFRLAAAHLRELIAA